jgi:hypothetical protein
MLMNDRLFTGALCNGFACSDINEHWADEDSRLGQKISRRNGQAGAATGQFISAALKSEGCTD